MYVHLCYTRISTRFFFCYHFKGFGEEVIQPSERVWIADLTIGHTREPYEASNFGTILYTFGEVMSFAGTKCHLYKEMVISDMYESDRETIYGHINTHCAKSLKKVSFHATCSAEHLSMLAELLGSAQTIAFNRPVVLTKSLRLFRNVRRIRFDDVEWRPEHTDTDTSLEMPKLDHVECHGGPQPEPFLTQLLNSNRVKSLFFIICTDISRLNRYFRISNPIAVFMRFNEIRGSVEIHFEQTPRILGLEWFIDFDFSTRFVLKNLALEKLFIKCTEKQCINFIKKFSESNAKESIGELCVAIHELSDKKIKTIQEFTKNMTNLRKIRIATMSKVDTTAATKRFEKNDKIDFKIEVLKYSALIWFENEYRKAIHNL